MVPIYKMFNKVFLQHLGLLWSLIILLGLIGQVMNFTVQDCWIYIVMAYSFLIFYSGLFIITSNTANYSTNFNWLLSLPISRVKFYISHVVYCLLQLFEVFVLSSICLIVSLLISPAGGFLLNSKQHKLAKLIMNIDFLPELPMTSDLLGFYLLVILGIVNALFILPNPMRLTSQNNFAIPQKYKKYFFVLTFFVGIYLISGPPPIITFSIFLGLLAFFTYYKLHAFFKIKPLGLKHVIVYSAVLLSLNFTILYINSILNVNNSSLPTDKLASEILFLGKLHKGVGKKTVERVLQSEHIMNTHMTDIIQIYFDNNRRNNVLDPQTFDVIQMIKAKRSLSSFYQSIALFDRNRLTTYQIEQIVKIYKTKPFFNYNPNDTKILTFLKRKFSTRQLRQLLSSSIYEVRNEALKLAIFTKQRKLISEFIIAHIHLYEENLTQLVNTLSFLSLKRVTFDSLKQANQIMQSDFTEIDCRQFLFKDIQKNLPAKLGQLYYCNNQMAIESKFKLAPIMLWRSDFIMSYDAKIRDNLAKVKQELVDLKNYGL